MTVIIDECLPKRMTQLFHNEKVWTVPQIGLAGYSDSELLDELEKRNIDIFVTIDGNIEYQQKFASRSFGCMVIRSVSNRFEDLRRYEEILNQQLKKIKPGQIIHIPY